MLLKIKAAEAAAAAAAVAVAYSYTIGARSVASLFLLVRVLVEFSRVHS